MRGADYVVTEQAGRLTDREGRVLARAGQTCDRVPAASLGWLLEQGLIERTRAKSKPAPEKVEE